MDTWEVTFEEKPEAEEFQSADNDGETGEIPTTEGQPSGRAQKSDSTKQRKQDKLASKTSVRTMAASASEEVA
jgi:hypothetical protein